MDLSVGHKALYEAYEKVCTEFFKTPVDGKEIDAFVDEYGVLHKFDRKNEIYGRLLEDNLIASIYRFDRDENPEKRWLDTKNKYLKGE